ncbi:PGN_0703 family putative restriction endonuclease [Cypionkella psychrotolerans]|uniref:PGN_0703 family putative restriction endonuclease n=1 Tax=Cypionkella psychrotolerans TaxID=1678131 RepID=UPI0006B51962|nr:hypothetical protein [Cypionkella psychrotolerans]
MNAFVRQQRQQQSAFFNRFDGDSLLPDVTYRTKPEHFDLNLNPVYASALVEHFALPGNPIQWHQHKNHALSSQVCCVNFLGPLMHRPDPLALVMKTALGFDRLQMVPVSEDRHGTPIFVDFEWVGAANHLGEWPANGRATRGANATSADAAVRLCAPDGKLTTVLIEWNFTETYGQPINVRGNGTRLGRYAKKAFFPNGPFLNDLGLQMQDFFWEPFYQLARQQMLAWRMERAAEGGADRVMVLHISAAGNAALHKVTAPRLKPLGSDAFDVFRTLLVEPSRFQATSIEQAFLPVIRSTIAADPQDPWAAYLLDRYAFLGESNT